MEPTTVSAILAPGSLLVLVISVAMAVVAGAPGAHQMRAFVLQRGPWIAFAITAIAVTGSLYYSEIARYTPCEMCWFQRGVAALVTDGVVRDGAGVLGTGLPVWCDGVAAPPSVAGLTFVDWQEPVGCGGVAVFPDDVIVVDDDGAVVIPAALVDEVVAIAPEQERLEEWIMGEVAKGVPLPGLYPPNAETRARYEAERDR